MALMVVLVWLPVADLIPQLWEFEAVRHKVGPVERLVALVLAFIPIVICARFLISPREPNRGALSGSGPTTAERIVHDMLRRK